MDQSSFLNTGRTKRPDSINHLPNEMLWKVFSYLHFKELVSVCCVSNRWKDVGNGVPLMVQHEYIITSDEDPNEIARTLKSIPRIRNLEIRSPLLANFQLLPLVESCTDVRNLHISVNSPAEYTVVKGVVGKFPNLESLSTPLWCRDQEIIYHIGACLKLEKLAIFETDFFENPYIDLKPIAKGCPYLVHLDIRCCVFDSDDFIYLLKQKKHILQSLLFISEYFDPGTVPPLSECTRLEHIACEDFPSKKLPLGVFLDEICSLPRLNRLGLGFLGKISVDDAKNLSKRTLPSVTALDLMCAGVNLDFSQAILSNFPNIRRLRIDDCCHCAKKALEELLKFKDLERLEIVGWCFSRRLFKKLIECKQVKHFVIDNCFVLSDKKALKLVTEMELRYLYITKCDITNKFLQSFPYCETLKELHVYMKNPLEQSVRELKLRQPLTRIKVHNTEDTHCK